MLTLPIMGALALGVLWVNTLLIVASAWTQRASLSAKLALLRASRAREELVEGEVVEGAGPEGAFALRTIEQVGRAMTVAGPQRILFTDSASRGEVFGGSVRVGGRLLEVRPGEGAALWCSPSAEDREGSPTFDTAWAPASTFKGFRTTLAKRVGAGARVWLWLSAPATGEGAREVRLVAFEDPLAVTSRARLPLGGVMIAALAGAAMVTALATWQPVFGVISTVGGVLGLAFFLAIQPLGTAARDRARLPDEQKVGGVWQRPG